jgi:5-epimerase
VKVRELAVSGAYEFTPPTFPDGRGLFVSPYSATAFESAMGFRMPVAQTNHSRSARGVVRGVHFADVPPGQAKYVYCPRGALLDIVIDLRVGSPTFGTWDTVRCDDVDFRAVYLSEGIGHAFVALEEDTVMSYLCSTPYNPTAEHTVNALDPELDLPWPSDIDALLSDRDRAAPSLAEAVATGLLPSYERCMAHYASLRSA